MQIKETQYVVVFGIFSQYSTPWYFRPPCRQKDSEEKTTVRAELFSRFHSPVDRSQFGAGADLRADHLPGIWLLKAKEVSWFFSAFHSHVFLRIPLAFFLTIPLLKSAQFGLFLTIPLENFFGEQL
jgi:hypothetical protein